MIQLNDYLFSGFCVHFEKTMATQQYDVAVVGAGPGGSAAATYLARAGLKTILFDKAEFPRDKTCGDGLSPRALAVLQDMGLLSQIQTVGYRITHMGLSAPSGDGFLEPIPQLKEAPAFATIVPRFTLDNIIREQALTAGATFRQALVRDIERQNGQVTVRANGSTVTAKMAVIATGANTALLTQTGILDNYRIVPAVDARTYFEEIAPVPPAVQFYFEGVPLPGYGWVFPLSATSANIGAGVVVSERGGKKKPPSPRSVMEAFIRSRPLQAILKQARQIGPIKGYPLRMDFATAPTFGEHILLAGEAAGLVNPITGEGIDYALESGHIAAHHLIEMFQTGDFALTRYHQYDQKLRSHFQKLFTFSMRARQLCLNRPMLNWLAKPAGLPVRLRRLVINIALGNQETIDNFSWWGVLKLLWKGEG